MVYDVENRFATFPEYAAQMKRWFVFPRQMLLPMITRREQAVTTLGSAANLIPGLLALLAVLTRRRPALTALAFTLVLFCAVYALCERLYLHRATPLKRWPLVPLVALLAPAQIIGALLSNNEVQWRGKRLVIEKGGEFVERET
jgi:ceramide glucosyltransferase